MANSANSTVSAQKPSTSSSSCSNHRQLERKKSCDTICSSNTSCFLQKRKNVHPLAASVRFGNKTNTNAVKQRVLSAKLLKLRSIQSQLNDANFHLAELAKENRTLRTLQKRQDKALKNYEGVDAELPRLIKSYEEEFRIVQDKNKNLKRALKEAAEHLKLKDDELSALKGQLRHLMTLTKDKHLGERDKLKRELEEAKEQIKEQENKISLLNRRLMLESKNANYKLNNEIGKHKQCQKELAHALAELNRNGSAVFEDDEDKESMANRKKILTQRPVLSSVSLRAESTPELLAGSSLIEDESTSDLTLEPTRKKSDESIEIPHGILKSPAENVKARLSAGKTKSQLTTSLKNLSIDDEKSKPKSAKSIFTLPKNSALTRTNSNHKLDLLSESIKNTLQKTANRDSEDVNLGDYCLEVVKTAKTLNSIVDRHKTDYQTNRLETTKILDTLKEADMIDAKIRKNKIRVPEDETKIQQKDIEIVNKMWFEEYNFQKSKTTDKNGNVKEVSHEDKKKLLATLKAIDNGEVIESLDAGLTKRNRKDVIKELFGHGSQ